MCNQATESKLDINMSKQAGKQEATACLGDEVALSVAQASICSTRVLNETGRATKQTAATWWCRGGPVWTHCCGTGSVPQMEFEHPFSDQALSKAP